MKILMILMLGSGRKETTKMDPILMRRIWKRINTDFGITRRTHIGDEHPLDFETKKGSVKVQSAVFTYLLYCALYTLLSLLVIIYLSPKCWIKQAWFEA